MSNRTIKLVPYSKEKFPQTKTINGIPVEEATKKYQTVKVITDEQGKPVRTGEDYFIDEQGNPLKSKELQEVVISAPAHLSDEEYRQYLLNSQDFNRRQGLPINYDNIPLFTYDNGITGKRNVNRNTYERYIAADNKSRAFNKQMDAIVAGATGIMASPYLLGAAALIPFHSAAPGTVVGNFVGDAAGMIAIDETSKALTGRTTGQHIGDALGLAEDSNWRYAVDFANPINIAGPKLLNRGVSSGVRYAGKLSKDLEKAFKPAIDFYKSGRLRGMYDAAKYGLYDRAQGLYIYEKMPSAKSIHTYDPYSEAQNPGLLKFNKAKEQVSLGTATPLETRLAESSPTGITIETFKGTPMVHDNESRSFTFFSPCNYLNREGFGNSRKSWDQRSWRLGFTPGDIGFPLPKSLVEASRGAIQKAPSGSFIGADAEYLTIPQSIERVGIWRTMIEGFNSPVLKGPRENIPGTKISPDAYRWFTLEAQKPGNTLVYAGKSPGFNNASVRPMPVLDFNPEIGDFEFVIKDQPKAHNYYIKDLEDSYKSGEITAKQYVDKFNEWAKEFGGRPAHVNWRTGEPFIYHPIIYKKQKGGSLYKSNNKISYNYPNRINYFKQ